MSLWDDIQRMSSKRTEIDVPGQEGPYYSLPCTVSDETRVRQAVRDADSPDVWARLVWMKLITGDGERVFGDVPWPQFKKDTPAWFSRRVGEQIYLAGAGETVGDAEGN